MNVKITSEREGQLKFYERILPRVDKEIVLDTVLDDYTDGVINGNILEFKVQINDVNIVLFQAIKYLSAMRIKGKEVPRNILLISLTDSKAYIFDSSEFINLIEKTYFKSASIDNEGLSIDMDNVRTIDYNTSIGLEDIILLLKSRNYTKINIDDNCILGWAERFYREKPEAKKQDFIGDTEGNIKIKGEIRNPTIFKEFINPYGGSSNIKFKYLMDKLNDTLSQKNLGAFYTPNEYALKSLELVRKAISIVPEGNDYIILDRCAGTGNLEQFLSDEELSHVIVSTLEYYEYKVLLENLGDKVRHVIPPLELDDTFNQGLVKGADALSEEYLSEMVIKQYIDNEKCTIILFENPPYAETTSIEHQKRGKAKSSSTWKNSYVVNEMKKEIKGVATNDLANAFIWSGFKYYLRQKTDSYILYSPIKYWKSQHLINKMFKDGYAFNRKHFHTKTQATISCIYWQNIDEDIDRIDLKAFDIVGGKVVEQGEMIAKRVYHQFSEKFYEKISEPIENLSPIYCGINGLETENNARVQDNYSDETIAYLVAQKFTFDNPRLASILTRKTIYNGNGFYIKRGDFLEKLPIFAAGKYTDHLNDWKIMSFLMKSSDDYERYISDVRNGTLSTFLKKVLFWTSFTHYSHIRSFVGSNGILYTNELCFDNSNGDTLAIDVLKTLKFSEDEENILKVWKITLNLAKKTKEYNSKFTYGLYQIDEELNTKYKDENDKTIYNYPELNGQLKVLKKLVKDYYINNLVTTLFDYEFLK